MKTPRFKHGIYGEAFWRRPMIDVEFNGESIRIGDAFRYGSKADLISHYAELAEAGCGGYIFVKDGEYCIRITRTPYSQATKAIITQMMEYDL